MAQFRKKPVVIDAHQFNADDVTAGAPDWFMEALRSDTLCLAKDDCWYIQTLESGGLAPTHLVTRGDWIIRGVQGELYPCKPDIFEATYQPAFPIAQSRIDEAEAAGL